MTKLFRNITIDHGYFRKTCANLKIVDFTPPPVGFPTSPANVLEWEKFSRRFYHSALMIRICQDAGFDCEEFEEFASSALNLFRSFEHWRPEGDGFDKNNWANGYMPGAWGGIVTLT